MDLIKHLLQLPERVVYQGLYFELVIFINGTNDVRLCYSLDDCSEKSQHYKQFKNYGTWQNPFYDYGNKSFLYLAEHIETEKDFSSTITHCHNFLRINNLIK